jgi:hypothetical protein
MPRAARQPKEEAGLSGAWTGAYWYPGANAPTPFTAFLVEEAGAFSGTTLEPATFGKPDAVELSATVEGVREGVDVRFTKLYDPADGVHGFPIRYAGVADPALERIEGTWRFDQGGSGAFVLVRLSRLKSVMRAKDMARVGSMAGMH